MKNNITNDQIIQSARRQRQAVDSQMSVAPWQPRRRQSHTIAAIIAVAASLVSFIAGYGIRGKVSQPEAQPLAQSIVVQHDTVMQVETLRDTIYQTRVVTRYEKPLMAQQTTDSQPSSPDQQLSPEEMACSMLCDDIPYELLATP
ncbi:MAG: hypothetical protein K6A96_05425 [Prevotella sp.]|nr:hypothetical protein [Prevotella sp.]